MSILDEAYNLVTVRGADVSESLEELWYELFRKSFGGRSSPFLKYRLNESLLTFAFSGENLVAVYGGLILRGRRCTIFVATDTMSDGTIPSATRVLGQNTYSELMRWQVDVVCGFPNERIRRLRERQLGWTLHGEVRLFTAPAYLWRIGFNWNDCSWRIKRPDAGQFLTRCPLLGVIAGGVYRGPCTLIYLCFSTSRPGPFFIPVPSFLLKPRAFGYKLIGTNVEAHEFFLAELENLSGAVLDLP